MPTKTANGRTRSSPKTTVDHATRVGETIYPNGLKLLTLERHEVPIVTVMIWYRVGSMDEVEGHTGLAHFLEHMMFKGTDRYGKGEIDRLTQSLGGSNNAMTSRDFTSYYFSVPAGSWDEILAIEANRMQRCLFDPEELALEKNVVLEEIKRSDDSPFGLLDKHLFATAYTAHPFRHPILGWQSDMERVTRDDVLGFYRKHYHPGNAFLVMVGDFETAEAARRVEAHFGRIPGKEAVREFRTREPEAQGERRIDIQFDVQTPRFQMLWRTVAGSDPDDVVFDVLTSLLTDGNTSVLHDRLVETTRLLTEVDSINDSKTEPGVFHLLGKCAPGVAPERGVAEIDKVLARLAARGPSRRSLEQARNQSEADYVFLWERVFHQAYLIGKAELFGDFRRMADYVADVRKVSADDIRRVLSTYLRPERRTLGTILPLSPGDAGGEDEGES